MFRKVAAESGGSAEPGNLRTAARRGHVIDAYQRCELGGWRRSDGNGGNDCSRLVALPGIVLLAAGRGTGCRAAAHWTILGSQPFSRRLERSNKWHVE